MGEFHTSLVKKRRMSMEKSPKSLGKVQGVHRIFQTSVGKSAEYPWKIPNVHAKSARYPWIPTKINVESADIRRKFLQIHQNSAGCPQALPDPHAPSPPAPPKSHTDDLIAASRFLNPPLPPPQNMNRGPITAPDIPSISTVPFCPVNSNHTSCGTACPTTCNDAAIPSDCISSSCVEGCTCTEGFVLDAGKCIPKSECGCVFGDRLYGLGEEFWGDDGCTKRCVCEKERRKAVCHQASCRAKEECGVKDGIRGCYPTSYGVCTAVGSTHYRSFDGKWFAFQGTCFYQLVGLCKRSAGLVDFQVLVQNGLEGGGSPSFITIVRVKVYGNIITFNQTNPNKITVSSPQFLLPHSQFLCSPLPSPQPNLVIPVFLLPFFSLCLGIAEYMTQRNRDFFLPPCD